MTVTSYAKQKMAQQFFYKGCNFIAAAILLRQKKGDEYVVLHLICQGTEIILKALLIAKDFDRYQPQLRKKYGHGLMPLARDALAEFKLPPLKAHLGEEFEKLDHWYKTHLFRYGLMPLIFIDPSSISSESVLQRVFAVIRLAKRKLPQLG
jgi:hypothetical protein